MIRYPDIIAGLPREEYFRQYRKKHHAKLIRYAKKYRSEHHDQIAARERIRYATNETYRKREIARSLERYYRLKQLKNGGSNG